MGALQHVSPLFKRNGGQTPPMALTVKGVWKRERDVGGGGGAADPHTAWQYTPERASKPCIIDMFPKT